MALLMYVLLREIPPLGTSLGRTPSSCIECKKGPTFAYSRSALAVKSSTCLFSSCVSGVIGTALNLKYTTKFFVRYQSIQCKHAYTGCSNRNARIVGIGKCMASHCQLSSGWGKAIYPQTWFSNSSNSERALVFGTPYFPLHQYSTRATSYLVFHLC